MANLKGCGRKLGPYDCCTVVCADCLEGMKALPDGCVDAVITDPPYGVTQNKMDKPVDLSECFRIGAGVIMTTQFPFTNDVVSRFRKHFKYDLIWDKVLTSGFLNASRMPLRRHEIVLVFGNVPYYPQKTEGNKSHSKGKPKAGANNNYGDYGFVDNSEEAGTLKYPTSILTFSRPHPSKAIHRTEKPIELMEYLVKTYSKENALILDPFLGSGTTAVAAKKLGRHFLGFEIEQKYVDVANERIALVEAQSNLFEAKPEQLEFVGASGN